MCGRYALALVSIRNECVSHVAHQHQRPSEVRQQLEQAQMPVEDAPGDDDVRQSYNFAPGYHGLVYRADGPEHGGQHDNQQEEVATVDKEGATGDTRYKLQAMQWGMFWTNTGRPRADQFTRARAVLDEAQSRLW
jgi:putative SOS response-associated peptidase YedK